MSDSSVSRDVISLFSGAMGLDIGLIRAGLRIAIAQDNSPICTKTIIMNGHRALGGDIKEIDSKTLLKAARLKRKEPFLICGGIPCQAYSTAGKRLGINDPRGDLFFDYARLVDEIRPRFFLLENVKGILSVGNRASSEESSKQGKEASGHGSVLQIILKEFSKLGYKTIYGIVDAVDYGVPQFRERFIMIGSRDHEDVFLPIATHFQKHQDGVYRWRTLRSAIEDLEFTQSECARFSDERLVFLKHIPQGENWRHLPPGIVEQAMGGAFHSSGGKVGFFRRLSYEQPSPTLMTSPVQKASMLCHPTQDRPLSVREYARIQQFPDNWLFVGSAGDKYRQIGNAVPVGLGETLGRALLAVAEGNASIKTKRKKGDRKPVALL